MTRAWFRSRLEADPRRWVLVIAAVDGLSAYALRADLLKPGPTVAVWCLFAAIAPASAVLAMLAHGRVLWWTGKLLRGHARTEELHAAFAWSQLPFVLAAAPLVLALPVRAAALQLDRVPASLQLAAELLRAASGPLVAGAAIAALLGVILHVRFLGEAQGFSPGRAIVNLLVALALGLALLASGAGAAALADGASGGVRAAIGFAVCAALAIGIEWGVRAASQRLDPREL